MDTILKAMVGISGVLTLIFGIITLWFLKSDARVQAHPKFRMIALILFFIFAVVCIISVSRLWYQPMYIATR